MKMSRLGRLGLRVSVLMVAVLALSVLSGPSAGVRQQPGVVAPGVIPPEIASLLAAYGAETVTIDRNARDYKLPEDIPWRGRNGTESATLFGDPSKPGLYVQLLKRGPNNWTQPHSHPNDRFITVLSGTFWMGTGSKYDQENTVALKAGGFVRDVGNQLHYDGTKEDGAIIEIVGMGPATTSSAAKQ